MANVLIDEQYLQSIANSLRIIFDTEDTFTPSQMAELIAQLAQDNSQSE